MTSSESPNRLRRRTMIITAASIAAVGLAGVFAIGANLGILTGADQSKVGTVSAAGDLLPPDTRVVDIYLDEPGNPVTATTAAAPGTRRFTIDVAGTVDVSSDARGVRVESVTPASGWTAAPASSAGTGTVVSFTDGTRTLEFTATVGPDGTVTGDVTESTAVAANVPRGGDHESDDHGYEGGESDD